MYVAHVNLAAGFRGGERQTQLLIEQLAYRGWQQRLVARRGDKLAAACRGIQGMDLADVSSNSLSAALALGGVDLVHVHEARAIQSAWLCTWHVPSVWQQAPSGDGQSVGVHTVPSP